MTDKPKVLADTCIWIEFFRTKSEISNRMRDFIAGSRVVGSGIILAELLQGVKTDRERGIIVDIFDTIEYLEITKEIWSEAGNLAGQLRSKGKTIPLSDIILACCARKYQYPVFTVDKHFRDIPGVKLV